MVNLTLNLTNQFEGNSTTVLIGVSSNAVKMSVKSIYVLLERRSIGVRLYLVVMASNRAV
jgi:hypothetical protein